MNSLFHYSLENQYSFIRQCEQLEKLFKEGSSPLQAKIEEDSFSIEPSTQGWFSKTPTDCIVGNAVCQFLQVNLAKSGFNYKGPLLNSLQIRYAKNPELLAQIEKISAMIILNIPKKNCRILCQDASVVEWNLDRLLKAAPLLDQQQTVSTLLQDEDPEERLGENKDARLLRPYVRTFQLPHFSRDVVLSYIDYIDYEKIPTGRLEIFSFILFAASIGGRIFTADPKDFAKRFFRDDEIQFFYLLEKLLEKPFELPSFENVLIEACVDYMIGIEHCDKFGFLYHSLSSLSKEKVFAAISSRKPEQLSSPSYKAFCGFCHKIGFGTKVDRSKAFSFLSELAEGDNRWSSRLLVILGDDCLKENETPANRANALAYYLKAHSKGSHLGGSKAGKIYLETNAKEGIDFLKKLDTPEAYYQLGCYYKKINDIHSAMIYYSIAGEYNHKESMLEVSIIHFENGNDDAANDWLSAIANLHYAPAEFYIANNICTDPLDRLYFFKRFILHGGKRDVVPFFYWSLNSGLNNPPLPPLNQKVSIHWNRSRIETRLKFL